MEYRKFAEIPEKVSLLGFGYGTVRSKPDTRLQSAAA